MKAQIQTDLKSSFALHETLMTDESLHGQLAELAVCALVEAAYFQKEI